MNLAMINPNMLLMEYAARGGGHVGGFGYEVPIQHGSGINGDLTRTFSHSAASAVAWRGVSSLFQHGHGLGLVVLVAVTLPIVVVMAVYSVWRRSR